MRPCRGRGRISIIQMCSFKTSSRASYEPSHDDVRYFFLSLFLYFSLSLLLFFHSTMNIARRPHLRDAFVKAEWCCEQMETALSIMSLKPSNDCSVVTCFLFFSCFFFPDSSNETAAKRFSPVASTLATSTIYFAVSRRDHIASLKVILIASDSSIALKRLRERSRRFSWKLNEIWVAYENQFNYHPWNWGFCPLSLRWHCN